MASLRPWEKIAAEKRQQRDQALKPYLVDDLDKRPPRIDDVAARSRIEAEPATQTITDIDNIPALFQRLSSGEFSAEEVALAYIKRWGAVIYVYIYLMQLCLTL